MLKGNKLVLPWRFLSKQLLNFKKKHIRNTKEGGRRTCQLAAMLPDQHKRGQRNGHLNSCPKNGEQPHLDLSNWNGCLQVAHPTADSFWRSVIAWRCITCGEGTIRLRIWLACSKFLVQNWDANCSKISNPQYLMRVLVFSSQHVDFTSCLLFPAQSFMSKEEAVHIKWKVYSIHLSKQSERLM